MVAKPFEPNEKEIVADMLGLPKDWTPSDALRPGVRHGEPATSQTGLRDDAGDAISKPAGRSVVAVGLLPG